MYHNTFDVTRVTNELIEWIKDGSRITGRAAMQSSAFLEARIALFVQHYA